MKAFYFLLILAFLNGCAFRDKDKRFRLLKSSETGIDFRNDLKESVDFNVFNYMYFYNGAGVAVGDINGDNLLDIYFTSNQGANKLYLNTGNFKFKDITQQSGAAGYRGWATGVTMADVNGDGRLDIYVGYLGDYLIYKGRNQLFINEGNDENGIPKFSDQAMEYALDLVGFSTQASFFDYDLDGDLDMYMLNHSLHQNGTFGRSELRYQSHPLAGDKLMRNDGGRFTEVTKEAGIYNSVIGYGLGIVVSDVNLDGWPDIYVGNDFHENDYLYINQRDGTFKESLETAMTHTSRYTMGCDFADFNNDGFPDLITMDMLPENPYVLKASAVEDPYDVYGFKMNFGYNNQYSRNSLQLNQQNGTYSEIGLFAGVAATDWSWSALFADFDLDGKKDIFVSNGILRRSNNLDYINFVTIDSIQAKLEFKLTENELKYTNKMPQIKLANFMYHNNGDSTFTNLNKEWGLDKISYSNGTAYADLDNDGDLDLVINNVQDEAFIYENNTLSNNAFDNNFLSLQLQGKKGNVFGVGAKVFIYQNGKLQMQECMPTRGYESSVDYRLHFGLGKLEQVDSLRIIWPDGLYETLKSVKANQHVILKYASAKNRFDYSVLHPKKNHLIEMASSKIDIPFKHRENKFVEFNREALLPHMLSAEGPGAAVSDINGDGLEDIFIGGGKWQSPGLFIQTKEGKFTPSLQKEFDSDSTQEIVDALFADVDGDLDNDLVIVTGGNEFSDTSRYMRPKLYLNNGNGLFAKSSGIPPLYITGSCISASDIDQDGDIDLFIGARTIPWKYGLKPDSYLLKNDGKGLFADVTDGQAPDLKELGFIKDSKWIDIDGDKDEDLLIAGEWMPVTILYNDKGRLTLATLEGSGLEDSFGWWNTINAGDFDHDGDLDFIAGNLGLNSKLRTSKRQPVQMYVKDFDNNGTVEQVLTHYMNGIEYPFYTRDEMTKQMPSLKKRFLSYSKFAHSSFHDIFDEDNLKDSQQLKAYTFETSYIENLGNKKFRITPLSKSAQFSPVTATIIEDFNNDGNLDILTAGNFYPINIQMGRYDASYGLMLSGNGKGSFKAMSPVESGLMLTGEVRELKKIKAGNTDFYLAIRNNDRVEAFIRKK